MALFSFVGWLEDIGLPHYKDAFSDACVDGRMLNYLTLVSMQHYHLTSTSLADRLLTPRRPLNDTLPIIY
jgi:hypothetical protein